MSCHCLLQQTTPLLRAVTLMAPAKGDPWVTVAFTPGHMVLHLATDDQCCTATATVPKELFTELRADTDCRFMVSLSNLTAALQLAAPAALANGSAVRIAYPDADSRCVVETHCGAGSRTLRASMITRPVKERLLDLRFLDAVAPNRAELLGEICRDMVSDINAVTPDHLHITFAAPAVCFAGTGGNYGSVTVEVSRHSDGVLNFEAGDDSVQPKYLCAQAMRAFGGFAASKETLFERVTLAVNTERQLSVHHHGRDVDRDAAVLFVLQPLSALLDL